MGHRTSIKNPRLTKRLPLEEAETVFLNHCRIKNLSPRTVQTKAVCPERTMTAAAPALWIRAVCSAVILIAGLVPHEAFKGTMIAIGKIHGIPPFGLN